MNQHTVPETYLASFANEGSLPNHGGFFHQYNYRIRRYRRDHVGNVCTTKDFYDILDDSLLKRYNETDPRVIEYNFTYEDNIHDVLNRFKTMPTHITREEVNFISEAYVSLKHRNPFLRKQMDDDRITGPIFEDFRRRRRDALERDVKDFMSSNNIAGGFDVDKTFENIKNKFFSDPLRGTNTHQFALIESTFKLNITTLTSWAIMASCSIVVIDAGNDFFLCSDNPGFAVKRNEVINTSFLSFDYLYFPINSKQAMIFYGVDPYKLGSPFKGVIYSNVDSRIVEQLNLNTIQIANESVFCKDREYLKMMISKSNRLK